MIRRPAAWFALAALLLAEGCIPWPQPALVSAVKILVRDTGVVRVSFDQLGAAGFRPGEADRARLRLSDGEREVPVHIEGSGLSFYGQAPEGRYVAERSYVLRVGAQASDAIRVLPAATPVTGAAATGPCGSDVMTRVVHLEQNALYLPQAGGQASAPEPWFGYVLRPHRPVTVPITLPPGTIVGQVAVTVRLWGASEAAETNPDHHVRLSLAGRAVADLRWDGAGYYTSTFSLPADLPLDSLSGKALVVDTPGDTGLVVEQAYLDYVELRYAAQVGRGYYAEGDVASGALAVPGAEPPTLVYDVTDPAAPVELTVTATPGCSLPVAVMAAPGARRVAVVPPDYISTVPIEPLRASDWHSAAHQADEIILAGDAFVSALAPLVSERQAAGSTVLVAPVNDIFDEFGGGARDPEALRAFLRYTQTAWRAPAPRMVLLVGDASYDYRSYLGTAPGPDQVPTFIVPAEYTGETVSDEPYADLNDDGRPELAVGRWPASTVEQVARIVARTTAYARAADGPWRARALFIADPTEPEFAMRSDRLIEQSGLGSAAVVRVYRPDPPAVVEAWNAGAWLVNYTGHGSLTMWGKDELMSAREVPLLQDAGGGPLVVTLTCLSGFYAHPGQTSLGEDLLWAPAGGAVAVVSTTSLTLPDNQEPFGRALIEALLAPDSGTLGEAFLRAKNALAQDSRGARDVINTFLLLGDPGLRLLSPG